jgi:hypothetical protein
MMLDGVDGAAKFLVGQSAPEVTGDVGAIAAMAQSAQHVGRADTRGQNVGELAPAVGPIVAVDGNMLDVGKRNARFGETIPDGFAGKATPNA